MDLRLLYDIYLKSSGVSTDSRNITPGCLFFALKGDNFNGNRFAVEAINKGAIAAVVDEDLPQQSEQIIRVDHVLSTLQQLAGYHRVHSGFTILALTGSNGKTTTKELCKAVLSTRFTVYATQGNLNNHIGVPLTLLAMKPGHQVGIIEMGANHPGEIAALCAIAGPDLGLITNIGKAHLEGFGGLQGVANAKGELFNYLMEHQKTLFLNEGDPFLPSLVAVAYQHVVRYNGNVGTRVIRCTGNPLLQLVVEHDRSTMEIHTNLIGRYNAANVLAACSVGFYFGIDPDRIKKAIQEYQPDNNRSQLIKTARNTVFMDAYNANPSSMEASIREFLGFEGKNKFMIIGEMREVGDSSLFEHQEIVNLLRQQGVTSVVFVGKAFEQPAKVAGYDHVDTVDQLSELFRLHPLTGYFVYVKGSRSNRLEKIISLL